MACRWRIRHKLMLGLGLVVAIMALLLTGTLKGLSSYRATMRTIDSKLDELKIANELRGNVKVLTDPCPNSNDVAADLRGKIGQARSALREYQTQLARTVGQGHDLYKGYNESAQVEALENHFGQLEQAVGRAAEAKLVLAGNRPDVRDEPAVKGAIDKLIVISGDLIDAIYTSLDRRMRTARRDYKISLALVLSTSSVCVLLMLFSLRLFYRWVFYPIRDLQQGAGRVAQGDFEHRIEVHSGDEMQDLAAAFNDMTGRLREMYRDLARQVNERSRQLVRSERLASVGFLAAGVAHEINNPLASIAFCSEALEQRLADVLAQVRSQAETPVRPGLRLARPTSTPQDCETITKYLKMIQQEAFRCKEITQRLLEFSRGGERRREPANLGEIIQSVLDVVQHLQTCQGKDLICQPAGKIIASVNAQEIKSVVLNLVVNALESMDEGGTLTITQRLHDGMAELVFQDNGCGMSPDVLENIFEPFYTRSRTGKGTGLGLSISHRIINQHGGEIEALSPGLNQGSTFTVRLPLQPNEEQRLDGGQKVEEGDAASVFQEQSRDDRKRKAA